ncbi:MAG: methionyl-tRNA formyltransferase [Lachnospiraceae bacterium]|nr:methionyl-tRNA formyltransferase [Lachnospiraceae bacterium]
MRIVFAGTPEFSAEILKALIEDGHTVAGVVTNPDRPKGRSGKPSPSPVKELAEERGIPVLCCEKIRREEAQAWVREKEPEAMIVAAFGQIVPKSLLTFPKYGCINVHASLLPAFRGAAPVQWAILAGLDTTGVTIMQMSEGLDTGDILSVRTVPIERSDNTGSLTERLAKEGAGLLLETLPKIEEGSIRPVPQPEESTTPYAKMITKDMGKIDWTKPAREIENLIRAMNPWPCASAEWNGKSVRILSAEALDAAEEGTPGRILTPGRKELQVVCGTGVLRIRELQLAGKNPVPAVAFRNGQKAEGTFFS